MPTDGRWRGQAVPRSSLLDVCSRRAAGFSPPGDLGLRLVYVAGIQDNGSRIGAIAVERPLEMLAGARSAPAGRVVCGERETFCFPTRLGPVGVALPDQNAADARWRQRVRRQCPLRRTPLHGVHPLRGPRAATRARWWRATTSSGADGHRRRRCCFIVGPLLDWRNRARGPGTYAKASLLAAAFVLGGRLLMSVASPADWADNHLFSGYDVRLRTASRASDLAIRFSVSPG